MKMARTICPACKSESLKYVDVFGSKNRRLCMKCGATFLEVSPINFREIALMAGAFLTGALVMALGITLRGMQ